MSSSTEDRRHWLFHPWESLSIEERRAALVEAYRSGACAAGAAHWGIDPKDDVSSVPPAAPRHYDALAPLLGPEGSARWRRIPPARRATDPRVCAFAEGWERARRVLLKIEPLEEGRQEREEEVRRTRTHYQWAAAEYQRAQDVLRRSAGPKICGEERLAVGRAHVALIGAREEHGRAVLLYRAADPAGLAVARLGENEPFPPHVW